MRQKSYALGWLAFFLIFTCCLVSCKSAGEDQPLVRPVKTLVVGNPVDFTTRTFPGRILATKEAKLAFEVPGRLIQLPVLEGDSVKAGQLLAEIDPKIYQEKYNQTQAVLIRTQAEYGRFSQLVKNGYVSRTDYDQKRAEFLVAEANFNTAAKDLKDTKILAPFSGIISRKYAKNFENVKEKQIIFLLQDLNQFDIEMQVPESLILTLKSNQKPVKSLQAVFEAAPTKSYALKVKEFSSEADPQTQTYRVLATFPAPKDLNVFPGMSVNVIAKIQDSSKNTTSYFLIPTEAVFDGPDNQPSVWVLDSQSSTVKRRAVKISRLEQNEIRVLSGLKPGERIVIAGAAYLRENEKVSILKPLTGSE